MKLCIHCEHYNFNTTKCMHDSAITSVDPVNGDIYNMYASENRKMSTIFGYCGKKAKFFVDRALGKAVE